jgi:hypothetical protein
MGLQFGICVVYEIGVTSNVVWTSSEVLKSDSDPTVSLSVDVELEIHLELETPFMKKQKKKLSKKNQKSPFSLRKIKIPGGRVKKTKTLYKPLVEIYKKNHTQM